MLLQAYIEEGIAIMICDLDKCAEDAFYVPKLEEHKLSNLLLQYQDFVDKQEPFFMCRWKDCLYACRSVDWPTGGGHYWCAKCARRYEPWVKSPERVDANTVMVYQMGGEANCSYASLTTTDGQSYCIVPCKWTDTIGMNIEDRFKRVASGVMDEIKEIAPQDRLDFIKQNCVKQGVHSLFTHYLPTVEEKKHMQERNTLGGKGQPKGQLDLAKFEANGSWGLHLTSHIDKLMDPLSDDDMMRNWFLAFPLSCPLFLA